MRSDARYLRHVSVLASMKKIGADPRLIMIISAESFMNDGYCSSLHALLRSDILEGSHPRDSFACASSCFRAGAEAVQKGDARHFGRSAAVLVDTSGILSLIPLALDNLL